MTQLIKVRQGIYTDIMALVDEEEGVPRAALRENLINGWVVIPANKSHKFLHPIGIGKGLRVKVNANLGASPAKSDLEDELKKLDVTLKAGADTVMDLTVLKDVVKIDDIRRALIEKCPVPIGTVPIYQAAVEAEGFENMSIDNYLRVFEKHARDGVDFATVHAGVTREAISLLEKRLLGVVSRGGSFLVRWMKKHNRQSFLYEHFDKVLDIAKEYDVTISLGDGLRPGAIEDSTDEAQVSELKIISELADKCRDYGVQVMIEGPGHVPLHEIEKNVKLEKELCKGAPFYVLGPLPTDIATGYDHIACAIGGALAAFHGADFLCYVTPKEHIGLPDLDDVREGVIVTKLAAHIADVARGNRQAVERNKRMSEARRDFNWDLMQELSLDPKKFHVLRKAECDKNPILENADYCSMCGEFCAVRVYKGK
ncbi:MAG: phosphomethylpyrimidine synthase ThiC [Nanoarchaeota archaeon]|nr:phosphomethylpyrimidine synthase ThiC [Nanoarchaeota archaeon]MBU1321161.1 phosphomethylpyrimidine synthase ThiC [Nanoarchaeota archaeon]MBU1596961.1 phosphomethylpyrimidine synthase ThiC [Nanoarchaeota archaeon]MBU2441521.1 phosphomethylpyrimidine synthase ThiC [Nanoarchaeota archaeon]